MAKDQTGIKKSKAGLGSGLEPAPCPFCGSARARDLAIEAAVHALIRLVEPQISAIEMQDRGSIEIHAGAYTTKLDGEPICHVALDGSRRFTITILSPNTQVEARDK